MFLFSGNSKLSGKNHKPTMALVGRGMSLTGCPTRSEATTAAIIVGFWAITIKTHIT